MLQAYNRRALRRNVEQSRALRYPDSGSDSDIDGPFPKVRRTKPRRHRPPRLKDSNTLMDTQFCKEDRCVEACLDGFPLIAFSSMKEYDEFRNGRLNPKRMANPIGTDSLTSDTPLSQNDEINGKGTKRRNETSKNISTSSTPSPSLFKRRRRSKNSSGQNIDPIPTSDDGGPLLQPGQGFFQSKSGTPYNPDTESGDSVYSDSTEYFRFEVLIFMARLNFFKSRPHSATLREKLPAEVKRNKKKRKVIKVIV